MATRDTLCSLLLTEVVAGSRAPVMIEVQCVYSVVQLGSRVYGLDGVRFINAE